MLKRLLCLLLTGAMLFSVTACTTQQTKTEKNKNSSESAVYDEDNTKTDVGSPSTVSDWFSGTPKIFRAYASSSTTYSFLLNDSMDPRWEDTRSDDEWGSRLEIPLTEDFRRVGPTDMSAIFESNAAWAKSNHNDRYIFEYKIYRKIGYMDVSFYDEYLQTKYMELFGENYKEYEQYRTDLDALNDPETYTKNPSVMEFLSQAEAEGKKVRYDQPIYRTSGKTAPGGEPLLVAYKIIGGTAHEAIFSASGVSSPELFENGDVGVLTYLKGKKRYVDPITEEMESVTLEEGIAAVRDEYLRLSPTELQKIGDFYAFEFRVTESPNEKPYTFLLTLRDAGDPYFYWLLGFYCPTEQYDAAKETFLQIVADARYVLAERPSH